MRKYRIASLLRQGVFCCVVLIGAAGCATYYSETLYYDVPRADGGVDTVRVYVQRDARTEPVISVTNRNVTDQQELDRILAQIYIPAQVLTSTEIDWIRHSEAFGDPVLGIRPKS